MKLWNSSHETKQKSSVDVSHVDVAEILRSKIQFNSIEYISSNHIYWRIDFNDFNLSTSFSRHINSHLHQGSWLATVLDWMHASHGSSCSHGCHVDMKSAVPHETPKLNSKVFSSLKMIIGMIKLLGDDKWELFRDKIQAVKLLGYIFHRKFQASQCWTSTCRPHEEFGFHNRWDVKTHP